MRRTLPRVLACALAQLLAACTARAPDARRNARDDVVTFHELDALPADLRAPLVRVHGTVVPGSVKMRGSGPRPELAFELEKGSARLVVAHTGIPPELFGDGADVIVEGVLAHDRASLASIRLIVRPPRDAPARAH